MMQPSLPLLLLAVLLPSIGISWKLEDGAHAPFPRARLIAQADHALEESGLVKSESSRIEISGAPVASIYQSPGCPGLIIVAPLPPTAQRFDHVVPGLDGLETTEGYVFRGEHTATFPTMRRILTNIIHDVRLVTDTKSGLDDRIFAYREIGQCGISSQVNWALFNRAKE